MDIDMDCVGLLTVDTDYGCSQCGRQVCNMCAVVMIGEGRECLQCKTSPKKWVGGIGWMPPAYA